VAILGFALCCDSLLGNLQEKVQKTGLCDELQLMYVQSIFGTMFLSAFTGLSGELQAGISKCHDPRVLAYLTAWSLLNMFGIVLMLKVAGVCSDNTYICM
jgi:hypothetical protein